MDMVMEICKRRQMDRNKVFLITGIITFVIVIIIAISISGLKMGAYKFHEDIQPDTSLSPVMFIALFCVIFIYAYIIIDEIISYMEERRKHG